MELYCIITISVPVLRVFVSYKGCVVERGCFKGVGCRGGGGSVL
jgi:hypothetical protein